MGSRPPQVLRQGQGCCSLMGLKHPHGSDDAPENPSLLRQTPASCTSPPHSVPHLPHCTLGMSCPSGHFAGSHGHPPGPQTGEWDMGQILTSIKGQTPAKSTVLEGAAKGHIQPLFSPSNREAGGGQAWVLSPGSAPQGPAPGRISFACPLRQDAGVHAGSWPGLIPSPSVPDMSQVPPPTPGSPGSHFGFHPLPSSPSTPWGGWPKARQALCRELWL